MSKTWLITGSGAALAAAISKGVALSLDLN